MKIPLKAARVAVGLSQDGLAEKMGVSRATVVAWETGKREMKPVYLLAFCKVTGFGTNEIFLPNESA